VRSNWTKKEVLDWFGDRGIHIKASALKKWLWRDNKLYFIIRGGGAFLETLTTKWSMSPRLMAMMVLQSLSTNCGTPSPWPIVHWGSRRIRAFAVNWARRPLTPRT
jgi:hypothetical protein